MTEIKRTQILPRETWLDGRATDLVYELSCLLPYSVSGGLSDNERDNRRIIIKKLTTELFEITELM